MQPGDLNVWHRFHEGVGPLPEGLAVVHVVLPLDHPGGHVAHLVGKRVAQPLKGVEHLCSTYKPAVVQN